MFILKLILKLTAQGSRLTQDLEKKMAKPTNFSLFTTLATAGLMVLLSACSGDESSLSSVILSQPEAEPNDTTATAQLMPVPSTLEGSTSSNGDGASAPTIVDADYYTFTLAQDANIILTLERFGDADLDLLLTNAADTAFSTPLATSQTTGSTPETISASLTAGSYSIWVNPWATNNRATAYVLGAHLLGTGGSAGGGTGGGGGGGGSGANCNNNQVSEGTSNDTFATARSVNVPVRIVGNVDDLNDPDDYSTFTLLTDSLVYASLTFTDRAADLDIFLYDSAFNLIDSSIAGTGSDELMSNSLSAGTYYMRVFAYNTPNASTDYTLCLQD
ncbi:MAG: hypothetical protein BMS9Abin36_0081 [Gammaproteobacteria bacterium]|nr:MAG: hypothetical protein BMS9Abin36_0081 [Gammaproteobacteria bacterium]